MAQVEMSVEVNRANLRDIDNMFKQLPKQVNQNKVWVKFWRHVSKPLVKGAKQNAASLGGTGQLAKSVGFFTTKASRKYNGGYVGPRIKGAFKDKKKSGYYGAWIEYGSEVKFGGRGYGKDQPFIKPAWQSAYLKVTQNSMNDAEFVMAKAIKSHERKLQKYGKFGY